MGSGQLRWSGGLLCAIESYPGAPACGSTSPTGYQYWSYWHGGPGTSTWTYSTVGPAGYRLNAGDVDAWRFVEGADSASEGSPRFASTGPCPAASPTTTSGSGPGSGSGSGTTPVAGPGAGSGHASAATTAGSGSTRATPPTSTGPATTTDPTTASGGPVDSSEGGGAGRSASATHAPAGIKTEQLAVGAHLKATSGSGSPVGPLLVVGGIAVLAAAALVLARRRASP